MNPRVTTVPTGWKKSTVGQACVVENNLREPISEIERLKIQGSYPYYGPTKVVDFIDHYRVDGKYALIGEDGDHFLKYTAQDMTQLVDGKFNVNNHAHLVRGNGECTTEWFFIYFRGRCLLPFLTRQGAGRYKLNKAALKELPLLVPSKTEQAKIFEIIQRWDRAIDLTERSIVEQKERRRGLMLQLLTGKMRLPGFDGAWKPAPMGSIFRRVNRKNSDGAVTEILSVTKNGIVRQADYFNKDVSSADKTGYLVVKRGEMAMSGLNFWMGSIDFQLLFDKAIVSPAYKIFQLKEDVADFGFMRCFIRSGYMRKILIGASIQGASIVRRNLDMDMLLGSHVKLPGKKEQRTIGRLLLRAYREINLLQAKAKALREQKKGLMQQLLTGKIRVKLNS